MKEAWFAMKEGSVSQKEDCFAMKEGSFSQKEEFFGQKEGSLSQNEGSFDQKEGSFAAKEGSFAMKEGQFNTKYLSKLLNSTPNAALTIIRGPPNQDHTLPHYPVLRNESGHRDGRRYRTASGSERDKDSICAACS
jgi:hypothetical protein